MNRQLIRLKRRTDDTILQVAECDDSDNLYVNVASGDIDVGTVSTISSVTDVVNVQDVDSVNLVDKVTEVDKAVLYGTDKAGLEWPVLVNDEGQLDTVRMQDSSVVVNSYMTFQAAAAQYTSIFADITNPDNETYDLYNLYITNPLLSAMKLSIRNTVTNVAGINVNHEIYTTTIPAAPIILMSGTAWSSCFTSIGGVLTDESGDINDTVPSGSDVPFAFTAVNDAIYFGHTANFRNITLFIGTAGVYDAVFTWEYWNGSAWTALPNIRASTGTAAAPFKSTTATIYGWTTPADWVAYDIAGDPLSRFWVRARVTSFTSITTAPALSQGYILLSRDAISHMYQIESMFNGGNARITISNDTALTSTGPTPIFYTLKKY